MVAAFRPQAAARASSHSRAVTTPAPTATPASPPRTAGARGQALADQDTITRLQIFLDEHSFGPGKIDGRWGEFAGKALQAFQAAHGQQASGQVDPALQQALQKVGPVYSTFTVTKADLAWVGNAPSGPAQKARLKRLLYRSVLDFIAERYHADPNFIKTLNKGRRLDDLKAGSAVQVPNVLPFQIESIQAIPDLPARPEFLQRRIKVDTKARMLTLFDGDQVVASFPITPGSKSLPAPIGTWKIVKVTTLPVFRWDKAMLNHGRRSSDFYVLPPGPRNPVGVVWIGLNKTGIGIHGTDSPDTIGRSASHGCIRLSNWDAARLVNEVTAGMTVEIF
ncbi:MAG: murein L,D-transpeptidase [Verrucomicrobia bacterium]|nr:murein L,D-transpeptidase [Verrucomicrobiota bacterium]